MLNVATKWKITKSHKDQLAETMLDIWDRQLINLFIQLGPKTIKYIKNATNTQESVNFETMTNAMSK